MIQKLEQINRLNIINFFIILYSFTLSFPGEIKRVITIILLLLLVTHKNRPKSLLTNQSKNIFLAFFIFLSYIFLSFLWTDSTFYETLEYIRKYWYLLAIYPIFIYLKKENIPLVISFFLLGIFVSEIFSYGNYFGIWEIGKGNTQNPTVFMYHVFYSIFLALSSLILLIKLLGDDEIKLKFIYLLFFITVTANLLLNVGRTGQITLIISIIIIIILNFRLKFKYLIYTFVLIISILITNYYFNSTFKNRVDFIKSDISNILEKNNYNTSLGGRIGFWILSKEILSENNSNLIFGVGAKQNLKKVSELVDTKYPELYYNKELKHFHSTYLSIITQFGLIGIILFLIVIISILRLLILNKELKLIKVALILVFMISSLVDVPFYKDVTLSLFALFIALLLVQNKIETMTNN